VTESNAIDGTFFETSVKGVYQPFVRVAVVTQEGVSREFDALIDTGAAINLVQMDFAVRLLRKSEGEITKAEWIPLAALKNDDPKASGNEIKGWKWNVTLRLRGTSQSTNALLLKDALIYATNGALPNKGLIIGQQDGLQGRSFVHLNYPNRRRERMWKLRPSF
jgi:hypothetical protein